MLSAYFSGKADAEVVGSEKWPPYNVCSIPFNVKKNEQHIKLKEPHKRFTTVFFIIYSANALIRQLSIEAAETARQNMDFDSFKPGDAIEVTVRGFLCY